MEGQQDIVITLVKMNKPIIDNEEKNYLFSDTVICLQLFDIKISLCPVLTLHTISGWLKTKRRILSQTKIGAQKLDRAG